MCVYATAGMSVQQEHIDTLHIQTLCAGEVKQLMCFNQCVTHSHSVTGNNAMSLTLRATEPSLWSLSGHTFGTLKY